MFGKSKISAVLVAAALVSTAAGAAALQEHRVPARQVSAEGTLLASPKAGMDPFLAGAVEPGIMSIVFTRKEVAYDFYNEAVANGEKVCLSDLGPQRPEQHGQRYWLRSC